MRQKLKKALIDNEFIQAPGAYDALTAKIIEGAGFPAVYMTGFGSSVAHFGLPDLGFLTLSEMVENAARIADAVDVPVIADADTGYGNAINVVRTVREYEKTGAAAIHIEDQQWPKRCGHMSGKKVIPAADMVAKIKAAVDNRRDPDFLIIARTDSIAVEGFDQAVERAEMYADAGADMLFVEAPRSAQEMAEVPRRLTRKPCLINMAPLTPNLSADELNKMGYAIAIYPGICLAASILACREEVNELIKSGRQKDFAQWGQSFADLNQWLDVPHYTALEQKYKT
ncbi:MAG: isocitrate lyase/PEP mutase family protein, partial [Desulfobacterales bacterium]|nr:isocitrate lyase/PEP mutase family protein [Desulfobacterales bacterium]